MINFCSTCDELTILLLSRDQSISRTLLEWPFRIRRHRTWKAKLTVSGFLPIVNTVNNLHYIDMKKCARQSVSLPNIKTKQAANRMEASYIRG